MAQAPHLKRVRAGVSPPFRRGFGALAAPRAQAGGEALELLDSTERDIANRLSDARLDVAVTILRPSFESFARETLRHEPYVLFVGEQHRLAGAESVEGGDLAGETMIVRRQCEGLPEISRYFTARAVRPSFSLRTLSDDRALSLVALGQGITVAPASFAQPGLRAVKLVGLDLTREVGLVFSDRARGRPTAFVEAARATYGAARRKTR